jgi:Cys-tRNA(Pro)/Cys-tRNA(Cys) deacylase
MGKGMKKTNAVRILESKGVPFELRAYYVDPSDPGAEAVAAKVGLPPNQVFKTLVARGDRTGVCLACVPGDAELDLKALAAARGDKKAEMVHLKEIQPLTGYVRGGVSPVGTKRDFPVIIDESALGFEKICVSAGMRGLQLYIGPKDLAEVVGAVFAPLAVEKE